MVIISLGLNDMISSMFQFTFTVLNKEGVLLLQKHTSTIDSLTIDNVHFLFDLFAKNSFKIFNPTSPKIIQTSTLQVGCQCKTGTFMIKNMTFSFKIYSTAN